MGIEEEMFLFFRRSRDERNSGDKRIAKNLIWGTNFRLREVLVVSCR